VKIETHSGLEVKAEVDAFYAKNGGNARARDEDLFFLARVEEKLAGAVRFCLEEGHPMLRSMMIREDLRSKGLGKCLLGAFAEFLDEENIRSVHCLPFNYLEKFYGSIGFRKADPEQIPAFLATRMAEYNKKPQKVICMVRF
jgi:N-acetylglutamate synthase-like GNAT family acetyltransferase